jgi:hypothetical protein
MKKFISVLLAALMLFSVMAVSASAISECTCDDHVEKSTCHCCIYCPENPSFAYVTPCHKDYVDGKYVLRDGVSAPEYYCCKDCSGFIDNKGKCGCTCSCCTLNTDGTIGDLSNPIGGVWNEIWDEEAQEEYVSGFQAVLKRISDVFDKIFDAIFEFLRLDQILGRN